MIPSPYPLMKRRPPATHGYPSPATYAVGILPGQMLARGIIDETVATGVALAASASDLAFDLPAVTVGGVITENGQPIPAPCSGLLELRELDRRLLRCFGRPVVHSLGAAGPPAANAPSPPGTADRRRRAGASARPSLERWPSRTLSVRDRVRAPEHVMRTIVQVLDSRTAERIAFEISIDLPTPPPQRPTRASEAILRLNGRYN